MEGAHFDLEDVQFDFESAGWIRSVQYDVSMVYIIPFRLQLRRLDRVTFLEHVVAQSDKRRPSPAPQPSSRPVKKTQFFH